MRYTIKKMIIKRKQEKIFSICVNDECDTNDDWRGNFKLKKMSHIDTGYP